MRNVHFWVRVFEALIIMTILTVFAIAVSALLW